MSKFEEIKRYSEEAYNFMKEFSPEKFSDGKYDLNDEGLFVNIQSYTTNPRENQKYEAHKKYIDVQYIIEGCEGFCLEDIEKIDKDTIITPYSEESDIMFFSNITEGKYHVLNAGEFLIMPPEIAHMPGIAVEKPISVRKMVVKIPVKS